ncbi:unnamed protein product [Lota lota]
MCALLKANEILTEPIGGKAFCSGDRQQEEHAAVITNRGSTLALIRRKGGAPGPLERTGAPSRRRDAEGPVEASVCHSCPPLATQAQPGGGDVMWGQHNECFGIQSPRGVMDGPSGTRPQTKDGPKPAGRDCWQTSSATPEHYGAMAHREGLAAGIFAPFYTEDEPPSGHNTSALTVPRC